MRVLGELQSQEDARHAFTAPQQDWYEISKKIISVIRGVTLVNNRPYGLYLYRSRSALAPKEIENLKWYCRDQWEHGWGEGYAHCPREGASLGLYIHFWQDAAAPMLTREQMRQSEHQRITVEKVQSLSPVTEITPDTFWTLLAQARTACDGDRRAAAYWLTDRLLTLGPEQAMNFHSIMQGYMESANKYGLWNAAILIHEDGCYTDGFEDFRAWLIFQGREVYMAALKDPDSLADVSACAEKDCRFEDLLYVGDTAYERLTGCRAYDDIAPDVQKKINAELQKGIVYGAGIEYPHEWSEVAACLPRLTAQHLTPEELRACVCRGHLWDHSNPEIQKLRAAMSKKKRTRSQKKKEDEAR